MTYLLTRNRRYLTFSWQVLKYGMVMAIIVLAFILFERLMMVVCLSLAALVRHHIDQRLLQRRVLETGGEAFQIVNSINA